jgi:alanine transaminase
MDFLDIVFKDPNKTSDGLKLSLLIYKVQEINRIMEGTSKTSNVAPIPHSKILTVNDLGPGVIGSSYLIRGCILRRANELKAMMEEGKRLPFEKFYPLHYGNPQLLNQPPISFLRDVIAGCFSPHLLEKKVFSEDVVKRVKYYLDNIPGRAIGAYADAPGFPVFIKAVSNFLLKRDGYPAPIETIYLTDGTLDGMIFVLRLFFSKRDSGVMLPMPEYPGYSFLASQAEGAVVTYSLNENDDWEIEVTLLN